MVLLHHCCHSGKEFGHARGLSVGGLLLHLLHLGREVLHHLIGIGAGKGLDRVLPLVGKLRSDRLSFVIERDHVRGRLAFEHDVERFVSALCDNDLASVGLAEAVLAVDVIPVVGVFRVQQARNIKLGPLRAAGGTVDFRVLPLCIAGVQIVGGS